MTLRPTTTLVLMALALGTHNHALQAQQIIEVTGQDRHLNTAFEEVFRVGTLDGEPWGDVRHRAHCRLRWSRQPLPL